jgi:chlorobactene glucosyltransferase
MGIAHHVFMYLVFRRVYRASVERESFALWYPIANLVVDLILIRAIGMCLTGNVTWRGTSYAVKAPEIELDAGRQK